MKFFSLSIVVLFIFLSLSSCKKIEGPGGAATIKGKVHVTEYDLIGNPIKNYDAPKFDVYIIYGNAEGEAYFDDDIETSYDGTFEFPFLEPGSYQVFVYEDCNSCFSGKKEKVIDVLIKDKKEIVDVGTIEVYENF